MKLLFVAAILVSLPFGLCGDDGADEPVDATDQRQAINAAMFILGDSPLADIPIGEEYDCGLSFPDRAPATPVPGLCRWDAEEQDPQWLVTFRETWACNQFSRDVEDFAPCTELTGFHEWQFLVTLAGGGVQLIGEIGQFPPDYATE